MWGHAHQLWKYPSIVQKSLTQLSFFPDGVPFPNTLDPCGIQQSDETKNKRINIANRRRINQWHRAPTGVLHVHLLLRILFSHYFTCVLTWHPPQESREMSTSYARQLRTIPFLTFRVFHCSRIGCGFNKVEDSERNHIWMCMTSPSQVHAVHRKESLRLLDLSSRSAKPTVVGPQDDASHLAFRKPKWVAWGMYRQVKLPGVSPIIGKEAENPVLKRGW